MPQNDQIPPVGQGTPMAQADKNGLPQPLPSGSASPAANGPLSYPIADAQKGFACPDMGEGYACTLSFDLPPPTPAPSASPASATAKGAHAATASPSPSPSPTPAPTATPAPSSSGSPLPGASPSPAPKGASVTLDAHAAPKDAPKMAHQPANALDTVALVSVKVTTSGKFPLDGWARAQFALPKPQVDGRGFALQIFQVVQPKHGAPAYKPVAAFNKSTLNDTVLTFAFKAPKMTIDKGSTYLLVLYGDDKSTPGAKPSALPSASPAAEPQTQATAEPAPLASPF